MKGSRTDGISLVALVITIIVLIILTGAVIATFVEGGIIDKAKEAVFKSDIRTYQEILAVKRAEEQIDIATGTGGTSDLNGDTTDKIQKFLPEFKEDYEGILIVVDGKIMLAEGYEEVATKLQQEWIADLGIGLAGLTGLPEHAIAKYAKVGQYVEYTPYEGDTFVAKEYEFKYEDSGYFDDDNGDRVATEEEKIVQKIQRQSNLQWRVLKNDGRQVTLISAAAIDNIRLGGIKGFLDGPDEIDKIYEDLYSGSKGTARNLNIDDVNEVMQVKIGTDVKPFYYDVNENEVELEKGTTMGDALDQAKWDTTGWIFPDNNYRNHPLYYTYSGSTYKDRNIDAYDLLFNSGTSWLSSNCVVLMLDVNAARYGLNTISSSIGEKTLFNAYYDDISTNSLSAGRPIVILNADVEVSNVTEEGELSGTAWKLK